MMENDPNKKESKGRRILKKTIRRNSKSSESGQNSGQSISGSRSKSSENGTSIVIKESIIVPNGSKERIDKQTQSRHATAEVKLKKIVEIQENHNEIFAESASVVKNTSKTDSPTADKDDRDPEIDSRRKNLKRKLEEESGAGTSGASTTSDTDADDKDPSKDKKKKNRCAVCRKKVGLTGFECRCGGLFCAVHRYSDKHECSFDYRELGAQEIRRNNPVVVSQKIHKI